ncbi:hypothetical protein [Enterococcus cecorum]|uniref:hypothetical protein n=1 Tax=Enterococcus cecorum TaxID=44008 RepID=UPI00148D5464|nr:hypothetical protein [Enterococcus cecorum]
MSEEELKEKLKGVFLGIAKRTDALLIAKTDEQLFDEVIAIIRLNNELIKLIIEINMKGVKK